MNQEERLERQGLFPMLKLKLLDYLCLELSSKIKMVAREATQILQQQK